MVVEVQQNGDSCSIVQPVCKELVRVTSQNVASSRRDQVCMAEKQRGSDPGSWHPGTNRPRRDVQKLKPTVSMTSSSSEGTDLWIGCDVCARWYLIDELLRDHWDDLPFSCGNIGEECEGENCELEEARHLCTALVRLGGAANLRWRSQPAKLPRGCWDVYRRGAVLCKYIPRGEGRLSVFAAPLGATQESRRLCAEALLHEAFPSKGSVDCITNLLGLRQAKGRAVRSGRRVTRALRVDLAHMWLLWMEVGLGKMVACAILRKQRNTAVGAKHLQGGVTLEYIAAKRTEGGKGYPLVLAAEEVCRMLSLGELFSACDMSQIGNAFGGQSTAALVAHQRWGFVDMDTKEWAERRLNAYSGDCSVRFMVKRIPRII